MRKLTYGFFVYSLILFGAPKAETKANSAIDEVQASWDKTLTYQADFKQTVRSKRLGTNQESTGKIWVKKPGKLRWQDDTAGATQILNGKKLWNIQENRRRKKNIVDVYADVSGQFDTKAFDFLAGKIDFKKSYRASIVKNEKDGLVLKLAPLTGEPGESYLAEIIKPSYVLRALTTESADSHAKIEFSQIKTGMELSDTEFEYVPKSTDTVHQN